MSSVLQPGLFADSEATASLVPEYEGEDLFLLTPTRVFSELASRDWAFTEDKTNVFTHDVHPYPAKFIPQIPSRLISALSRRGDLVLDPFGGSGTAAVEALRLGRRALSVDANPISALIGRVKCMTLTRDVARELSGFAHDLSDTSRQLPEDASSLVRDYSEFAPTIPNREKWFPDTSFGELAFIRARILQLPSGNARDVALTALSRIVLRVSFQDSETRYKSVPRTIAKGEVLQTYLREFGAVCRAVQSNSEAMRHGVVRFITADSRSLNPADLPDFSVDLVVTSPPYGNATDYHLYHRFRLLWLGFDPKRLCEVEIGSHLKHQREQSGFEQYMSDLERSVARFERALKPGRYAALVLGDSVYDSKLYRSGDLLKRASKRLGFDSACIIDRPIHARKRSFAAPARRASTECILLLRKKSCALQVSLIPPPYKLWHYEVDLRKAETDRIARVSKRTGANKVLLAPESVAAARRLVFSHAVEFDGGYREPTWQAILENGLAKSASARKDPKYVTHGLHAYKGKFYPQLAKSLMQQRQLPLGSLVLDPFCGSGTTILEAYLGGHRGIGVDMNPLAARIAAAKTQVLELAPDEVEESLRLFLDQPGLVHDYQKSLQGTEEFQPQCLAEIQKWFAPAISSKLNALLHSIRNRSPRQLVNFLEIIVSSIVRDISHQEPSDLRIRYREKRLDDIDVFGLFTEKLAIQLQRLEKYWSVRGWASHPFVAAKVRLGDSRHSQTLTSLGATAESVDLILTSPPYATALPYIDTDRLSLLTILGIGSSERRPIEQDLIGSREISTSEKNRLEQELKEGLELPVGIARFLKTLSSKLGKSEAGFRRQNMPALLGRFFAGMQEVLRNCHVALKTGSEMMLVIGDNQMQIDGALCQIPTASFVEQIASEIGFQPLARLPISVTTENMLHQKHAITKNVVLRLKKGR